MAPRSAETGRHAAGSPAPAVQAAAALSFLKETRGLLSWTLKDVQKSLLISAAAARDVIAALELQGYVRAAENRQEWLTTIHGEAVSGSKAPRFSREAVEKSIEALRERINFANNDRSSPYKIVAAVAFGDFLHGGAQAQAADVGVQLAKRDAADEGGRVRDKGGSLGESQEAFLKELRSRDLKVSFLAYQPWLSERSHLNLLANPHLPAKSAHKKKRAD